ncbi:MAG: thioredoxin domain-containing protein, partial [Actinoplanes sp.]
MANRLAGATSPYLLQHKDNPVDWWEWSAEAFAEAERRDVPVLISVGYAACHWCHVMAHESFESDEIAKLMNDGFVAIKVDREERPDVDAVYMTATQAMTGQGGWPMTVFATPDGVPFFCGTY